MPENTLDRLQALLDDELAAKRVCRCAFKTLPEDVQAWLRKQVGLARDAASHPRWRALTNSIRRAELGDLSPETLRFHFDRHE